MKPFLFHLGLFFQAESTCKHNITIRDTWTFYILFFLANEITFQRLSRNARLRESPEKIRLGVELEVLSIYVDVKLGRSRVRDTDNQCKEV